jgi:hypothetical protein
MTCIFKKFLVYYIHKIDIKKEGNDSDELQ